MPQHRIGTDIGYIEIEDSGEKGDVELSFVNKLSEEDFSVILSFNQAAMIASALMDCTNLEDN